MAKAISVRLDDETIEALSRLEATGMSRSEAIRRAIIEAAGRLGDRKALAAEVAELERDAEDRAETLELAGLMEQLRAEG